MTDHPSLKITDARLHASLLQVYEYADEIMKDFIEPHFTDHGVGHLERILKMIDLLLTQNDQQDLLSERERYVLVCGVLLHDIGMQYEVGEPEPGTRRGIHHRLASQIISDKSKDIGLNEDLVKMIALVAEGHRGKIDERYKPQTFGTGEIVRCDLLASLLYLCDELDISHERTSAKKKAYLDFDVESELHFFKHYYVQGVGIGPDRCLHIAFRYPKERGEQYHPIFSKMVLTKIEETIKEVTPVLQEKYGVFLALRNEDVSVEEIETLLPINPSLFEEISSLARGVRNYRFLKSMRFKEMKGDINAELFYKGNVRWADIVNELDIPREQDHDISDVLDQLYATTCSKQAFTCLLICGEGGSGKSTSLMKLAYETKDNPKYSEADLLWLPPDCDFVFAELLLLHNATRKPVIIFMDGMNIYERVDSILEQVSHEAFGKYPIMVVIAARLNEWENAGGKKIAFHECRQIQLGTLVDVEIEALLGKLEEHNQLYELAHLPPTERTQRLKSKSEGQLLVAMLEATHGKRFHEIILDEYHNLKSRFPEAAKAYELINLFYIYNVLIPQELLITLIQCTDETDFENTVIEHTKLVIIRDRSARYGTFYRPRHREIAAVLVNKLPDYQIGPRRLKRVAIVLRSIFVADRHQRYVILNFLNNYVTSIIKTIPKSEYQDRMDETRDFMKVNSARFQNLHDCAERGGFTSELIEWARLYRELRLIFENIGVLERIVRIEPFDKRANYYLAKLLSRTSAARDNPEKIAGYYHNSFMGGNRRTRFLYEYLEFCLKQSLFDHLDPIIDSFKDFISYTSEEEDLKDKLKALIAGYKLNKDRSQMVRQFVEIASHVSASKDLSLSDELAYIDLVESGDPKTRLERYEQHLLTIFPSRPRGILLRIAHTATVIRGEEEKAIRFFAELFETYVRRDPQPEDFDVVFEYVTFAANRNLQTKPTNYGLFKMCKKMKPTDLRTYVVFGSYAMENGDRGLAREIVTEGIDMSKRLDRFDSPTAESLKRILEQL